MNQKILHAMTTLLNQDGLTSTYIPGVSLYKRSHSLKRTPQIYKPSLVFIIKGYKNLYLEDKVHEFRSGEYLLVSLPTPIVCETFLDGGNPFMGLSIEIDSDELYTLIKHAQFTESKEKSSTNNQVNDGVLFIPINEKLEDALLRLLDICMDELDSKILGKSIVNEILFQTIKNTNANRFCDLVLNNKNFTEFSKILETIHTNYAQVFVVDQLAKELHMSIPTFHRNFKGITGYSPIQYIKNIRLNKAKKFLDVDGFSVKESAKSVGYTSQSQFSREYKRYFGYPPIDDAKKS